MTARDAFDRDMDPLTLDANTAERLVTGAVGVDDAPPPYRSVVRVLEALRADPERAELAGGPDAVDGIASVVVFEPRAQARHPRRRRVRAGLLAVVSVASCMLLTGGLAAAGALPEPAQRVTSAALSHIGISVPTEEESHADEPAPTSISVPASTVAGPAQPTPFGDQPGSPRSVTGDVRPALPPDAVAESAPEAHEPSPPAPQGNAFGQSPGGPPPGDGQGQPAASPPDENDKGNGNANPHGNAYGLGNGNAHAFGVGNGGGPG